MVLLINKRRLKTIIIFIALIVISTLIYKYTFIEKSITTNTTPKGYIAIVIDDLGSDEDDGMDELLKLDIPITVAVMPFLNNTEIDAKKAYDTNMEIILHLPMEPEYGDPAWLGPETIRSDFSVEEVRAIVQDALDQLQWAKGINNHMGSKIMKDEVIMRAILNVAKERNLYFLNSRTEESTVAEELCKELNVDYYHRNIFLDNEKNQYYIEKSMEELSRTALENGYAVGIGHLGEQGGEITINVIDEMSKKLKQQGIEFIYLSEIKTIQRN